MIPVDVLDDREVDQLLEGHVPAGRDELAPLAAMIASIRAAFSGRVDDGDAARRQLPVIRRLALLVTTDNGDPAAMSVSKADRPRPHEVSGLPKWRRRSMSALLTSLLSSVAGKVAVGAVSLAAVTGGVMATSSEAPDTSVVSTVSDSEASTTDDSTAAQTTETSLDDPAAATTDATLAAEGDAATTGAEELETAEIDDAGDPAAEPKNDHGAAVSAAAQDHSQDEACGNHGRYVSSVARGEAECTPPPGQAKKEAATPAAASAERGAAPPAHSNANANADAGRANADKANAGKGNGGAAEDEAPEAEAPEADAEATEATAGTETAPAPEEGAAGGGSENGRGSQKSG